MVHTLKNWIKSLIPPTAWERLRDVYVKMLRFLKKDLDYIYNEDFSKGELRNKAWTREFYQMITHVFDVESVIDFGCGTGDILVPFEREGMQVLGLEGSKWNAQRKLLQDENFQIHDLRQRFTVKQKYDLCFCFEVAEHIDEKYSDRLVDNLTGAGSTILFTAAPPGQDGHDHINLKPKAWWRAKFSQRNFEFSPTLTDELVERMQNIDGLQEWYIRNLMVFVAGQPAAVTTSVG